MSAIVEFYAGRGTDGAGRRLDEVWRFAPRELETRHDFIQWLFPLREPSRYNPAAPLLAADDEAAFRAEPLLRDNLLHSLDLMLGFYGLSRNGTAVSLPARETLARAPWLAPGDHNHLRLSRIVQSLQILGQEDLSRSLQAALLSLAQAFPDRVAPRTVDVWSSLLAR